MRDYTSRGNLPHFAKAAASIPFPEWVTAKPVPVAAEFVKMSSEAFADKAGRRYPVSNPVATFYSALDAFANADTSLECFDRIKQACDMFCIAGDVAPYADVFADELEKSASAPDSAYAFDTEIAGERVQLLPVNDSHDVVQSANDLIKMASERRIPYIWVKPAATTIVKAAEDLDVLDQLPQSLRLLSAEKLSQLDTPEAVGKLRSQLHKRAEFVTQRAFSAFDAIQRFDNAVDEFDAGDITPTQLVEKIASVDMLTGIDEAYNYGTNPGRVVFPHELVFNGPILAEVEKFAKFNVLVNEIAVPIAAFDNLNATEAKFKLSARAASAVDMLKSASDARDISLEVENWTKEDRATLCRLLVSSNQ